MNEGLIALQNFMKTNPSEHDVLGFLIEAVEKRLYKAFYLPFTDSCIVFEVFNNPDVRIMLNNTCVSILINGLCLFDYYISSSKYDGTRGNLWYAIEQVYGAPPPNTFEARLQYLLSIN